MERKHETHLIMVEDCDRDALTVAATLVRFAIRERILSPFKRGHRQLNPEAVLINLERIMNDWDAESANTTDTSYPVEV